MAYAPGITLRPWTVGGTTTTEAGEALFTRAKITASRSLMLWGATGWRYESATRTITSTEGAQVSGDLPVCDQGGWRTEGNAIIDVSVPGSYTHVYTIKVSQFRKDASGREIPVGEERTYANVFIPTGDLSPFDLDLMLPVATIAGGVVLVPDSWDARVTAAEAAAVEAVAAITDSDAAVAGFAADGASATRGVLDGLFGRILQDRVTEAWPVRPAAAPSVEYVGWTTPPTTPGFDFDTWVNMPTRPASDVLFADFSAYPVAATPETWQPIYDQAGAQWMVREDATATGGVVLAHEGIATSAQTIRGILWIAVPDDPARTQVEVVFKWQTIHVSNNPCRVMIDATGSTGTSGDIGGIHAGLLGSTGVRISEYVAGARTDYATGTTVGTAAPGLWMWTRAQIDGTTVRVRHWRHDIGGVVQEEPATWGAEHTFAGFGATARVGILAVGSMSAGVTPQVLDVVGIGLNGQPAPKVAP